MRVKAVYVHQPVLKTTAVTNKCTLGRVRVHRHLEAASAGLSLWTSTGAFGVARAIRQLAVQLVGLRRRAAAAPALARKLPNDVHDTNT